MFVADYISHSTSINTGAQFYVLPGFDASIVGSFGKWLICIGKKLNHNGVKSMPNKIAPTRQKIWKRSVDKTNKKVNGSSGILKFFTRL